MSLLRLFAHRADLLPVTVGPHYLFPPANLVVSLVSLQLVIVECHCCVIISRSSGNSFINKVALTQELIKNNNTSLHG